MADSCALNEQSCQYPAQSWITALIFAVAASFHCQLYLQYEGLRPFFTPEIGAHLDWHSYCCTPMVNLFTEGSGSTVASITGLGAMFSAVEKGATRVSISWLSVVFASVAATTEMASAGEYVQRRNVLQNTEYIIRKELLKLLRDDIETDIDNIPIAELGIDSLDFFEMLLQIEEDHGIEIEIDKLDEKITLQTLIALV